MPLSEKYLNEINLSFMEKFMNCLFRTEPVITGSWDKKDIIFEFFPTGALGILYVDIRISKNNAEKWNKIDTSVHYN